MILVGQLLLKHRRQKMQYFVYFSRDKRQPEGPYRVAREELGFDLFGLFRNNLTKPKRVGKSSRQRVIIVSTVEVH